MNWAKDLEKDGWSEGCADVVVKATIKKIEDAYADIEALLQASPRAAPQGEVMEAQNNLEQALIHFRHYQHWLDGVRRESQRRLTASQDRS